MDRIEKPTTNDESKVVTDGGGPVNMERGVFN